MKIICRIPAVLLLCTLIACNHSESKSGVAAITVAAQSPASENEIPAIAKHEEQTPATDSTAESNAGEQNLQKQYPGTGSTPKIDWDKKIVKNAHLVIEVKDHTKFNGLVQAAVKQAGGYIAQAEQNKSDYKIEHILTIKVPVDQFDVAVTALTNGKENIITQKVTSQDVTGEVVDTRARLEAKRQVRLRYLDLLKQAKNMEEILQVQKEINDIQVEMEAAAGRVNYLTHSAALNTIELTYYQILNAHAGDHIQPTFGQRILNALQGGLEWLGELLLILLTLWPVWMGLVGIWWGYRKLRSSKPGSA